MSVRDYQERKKIERILFSVPIIIIFFAFASFALWGVARVSYRRHVLNKEVETMRVEMAAVEQKRATDAERLRALETPEGIEREARGKFNLKKEGETVVLFVDSAEPESSPNEDGGVANALRAVQNWFASWF